MATFNGTGVLKDVIYGSNGILYASIASTNGGNGTVSKFLHVYYQ